jgi:peptidoglycan/LPS O-acetylase OafA/YrhL
MTNQIVHSHSNKEHIDSLDGFRGIAVLMVLGMHAACFANGWAGVDLFFVLSGFLITGILRRTRTEPFYWRRFYIKRATRILPPLLLAVPAAALVWPQATLAGAAGYLSGFANVVDMTRYAIYPLVHLWSLSVEEHYYFFWPFAVLFLSRRQLLWVIGTIVVSVPIARLLFTYHLPPRDPYAIYLLTPFRIDGIAMGSMLALLLEDQFWQEKLRKWSGIAVVVVSATYLSLWTVLGHSHFYPQAYNPVFNSVGYLLVALAAFFAIAYAFLRPEALPTRMLRIRPLAGLGVISYGLYVYSWILLVLIHRIDPSLTWREAGLIHVAIAIPLSTVLFRFYERPITAWGRRMAGTLSVETKAEGGRSPTETGSRRFEVEAAHQAGVGVQ